MFNAAVLLLNQAVRHLSKSQQEEYRRLKQQILERERLKQLQLKDQQKQQPVVAAISKEVSKSVQQKKVVPVKGPSSKKNEIVSSEKPDEAGSDNVCENCNKKIISNSHSDNISRETLIEFETNFVNAR